MRTGPAVTERRIPWALATLALAAAAAALACGGPASGPGSSPTPSTNNSLGQTFDARFKDVLERVTAAAGQRIITYAPINDTVLTRKVTIDADYYSLGYQTGLMAREIGISPRRRTEADRALNERIAAMYADIYPQHLEKARGVASAFGLTLDDLDLRHLERDFYIDLYWVLFNYEQFRSTGFQSLNTGQCSILAVHPVGGPSLVGRNFDYGYNVPRFFMIANISGVYRTIGNTGWAWNHWIMDGINEKGLFIGVATNQSPAEYGRLGYQPYPDAPAVNAHHMMAIVLDTCGTVSEALRLIGRMRIWFSDEFLHFMIADADGNSAVVEFDGSGRLVPFVSTRGYQVVTNTALQVGEDDIAAQCWRYARATSTLGSTDVRSLDDLLAVNRSISMSAASVKTLWISLADLPRREMDVRFIEESYAVPHRFRIE
jgi:predicted choloylglycine hydrolase